ncbi:AbiH family protein [Vagococcus carniphilus]|uniref:AbiH family protein n=1 Tax=Vagococcus carniphilus TaxID=218144 RepID=UPI00288EA010|nr:AbiH family protein [Vagococcus carniphilus]MDT2814782.1 AbiH family protein [Vagococcus carniphilus]MDT2864819.1 AbiH family protein [Vagococcus carniphilus]
MNITFLLGNGFDIQCGLKTSYFNFYEFILNDRYGINIEDEYSGENFKKIDNIIYGQIYSTKETPETWADLELQLGEFTKIVSSNTDKEIKNDIAEKFLDDYETLNEDLNSYLKIVQIQDDTEIDTDYSEVLRTTTTFFYDGLLSNDYLEVHNKLVNNRAETFNYNFISFNYTNTLTKIFNNSENKTFSNGFNNSSMIQNIYSNVIYVHGKVDFFVTLGVNDESQIADNFFNTEDITDMIKPNSLMTNRENMKSSTEELIRNSEVIVIFGMSLGKTDRFWWEKIAKNLLSNKNNLLILHIYERNNIDIVVPRKVRKRREKYEQQFLSHLDSLDLGIEEINQLKTQIYVITNSTHILNVNLAEYLPELKKEVE